MNPWNVLKPLAASCGRLGLKTPAMGASWIFFRVSQNLFRSILGHIGDISNHLGTLLGHLGHLCRNLVTRQELPDPPGPIFGSCFGAQFCSETCSISFPFLGPVLDVFGGPFQGPSRTQKWSRNYLKTIPKMGPLSEPLCKAASGGPEPLCTVKPIRNQRFQIGI